MKQIRLKTCLLLQAALALLLPVFYFLSFSVSREGDAIYARVRFDPFLLIGLALLAVLAVFLLRRKREKTDEFARDAIRRADTICFRVSLVFLGAVLLPALLALTLFTAGPVTSADVICFGWVPVIGFFLLFLLRAVLYCRIERKGMAD